MAFGFCLHTAIMELAIAVDFAALLPCMEMNFAHLDRLASKLRKKAPTNLAAIQFAYGVALHV